MVSLPALVRPSYFVLDEMPGACCGFSLARCQLRRARCRRHPRVFKFSVARVALYSCSMAYVRLVCPCPEKFSCACLQYSRLRLPTVRPALRPTDPPYHRPLARRSSRRSITVTRRILVRALGLGSQLQSQFRDRNKQ